MWTRIVQLSHVYTVQQHCGLTWFNNIHMLVQRVVTGSARRNHIQPVLKELHWLPVAQRVQYKVAVITHKVLSTRQPLYLADIIKEHRPARQLRSSTQNLLAVRKTNTRLAERAFSISSAAVWNSLPYQLRSADIDHLSFKKRLKTHFFAIAYCL